MLGHFIAAVEPEFLETMVSINFFVMKLSGILFSAVPKNAAHLTDIKKNKMALLLLDNLST
ncbi:hypothetical protein [Methylomicrobium sp. Wu6]|uniref:hypothetical protein n=1 Tax=Methylomicrobium sp. Wu6 TaxID=3107928 RepID=UPI002DD697E8|nr:hypothetical protein [Methylomicrobium sp. Wu6]